MAHGFTKSLTDHPMKLFADILDAQTTLEAKRKLTRIMRTKSSFNRTVAPGDYVEVFSRLRHQKCGSWSSPRAVLSAEKSNGSIIVPGSRGLVVKAALEDVRVVIINDCFAQIIREANDVLDRCVDSELYDDASYVSDPLPADDTFTNTSDNHTDSRPFETSFVAEDSEIDSHDDCDSTNKIDANIDATATAVDMNWPAVGDQVEIYWPLENALYPGLVAEEQNESETVVYDDGRIETLDFDHETWRSESRAKLLSIEAFSIRLEIVVQNVLDAMINYFGNKPFIRHQAQAFPSYVLHNAYAAEENDFKKTVQVTPMNDVPNDAKIITSQSHSIKN